MATKRRVTKSQIKKVLECTIELFKDKSRFTTGTWARTNIGWRVSKPKSKDACSWCLEGGLMKCSPDFPKTATYVAADEVSAIFGATEQHLQSLLPKSSVSLFDLNDSKGLPAVRKLLKMGLKSLETKKVAA